MIYGSEINRYAYGTHIRDNGMHLITFKKKCIITILFPLKYYIHLYTIDTTFSITLNFILMVFSLKHRPIETFILGTEVYGTFVQ